MKGVAAEKVEGGKLVRCKVDFHDVKIYTVQVTGDFFLHPEEKLKDIEELFVGKNIFFDEKIAEQEIEDLAKKMEITMVGINSLALIRTIKAAIKNAEDKI